MNGNYGNVYDDPACLSLSNPPSTLSGPRSSSPYSNVDEDHYSNVDEDYEYRGCTSVASAPQASVPIAAQTGVIGAGRVPDNRATAGETVTGGNSNHTDSNAGRPPALPDIVVKEDPLTSDYFRNIKSNSDSSKRRRRRNVIIVSVAIALVAITGVVVGIVVGLGGGGGGGDASGNATDTTTTLPSSTGTPTTTPGDSGMERTDSDNQVLCWGSNRWKQSKIPDELVHKDVKFVIAGEYNSCAAYSIESGGGAFCWGANWEKQSAVPDMLARGSDREIISMGAGDWHTCAIYLEKRTSSWAKMRCWGENRFNQIPSEDELDSIKFSPSMKMPDYPGVFSASNNRTCLLDSSGQMHCFGWTAGQLNTLPSSATKLHTLSVGSEGFMFATSFAERALYRWDLKGSIVQTNLNSAANLMKITNHSCARRVRDIPANCTPKRVMVEH
eukprot:Nk52_evm8s237 gene=Nk52_evmTU8s237